MNRRAFLTRSGSSSSATDQPAPQVTASRSDVVSRTLVAGLEPYIPSPEQPWERQRAVHLLRRVGFGAPIDKVNAILGESPGDVVDGLVDEAVTMPVPDLPDWALIPQPRNSDPQDVRDAFDAMEDVQRDAYRMEMLKEMREKGLREKMMLFWSNHFVTELRIYNRVSYMAQYVHLLRTHALGNFKTFVYEVGLLPAMLVYLNGDNNRKDGPNENYARELLELFTMGITDAAGNQNYTQEDIVQVARALTGWVVNRDMIASRFRQDRFDEGEKTFFGRTGAFGYDDVVDIIFEERPQAIAHFVCRKLYKFFVYAEPDETLVAEMATQLVNGGFEIAPVLRTLLKSARFFEKGVIGAKIKSPIELIQGFVTETGANLDGDDVPKVYLRYLRNLTQELMIPPNVAGWSEHRSWLSTETLPNRWNYLVSMIQGKSKFEELDALALANQMSDPTDPYALSRELADFFLTLPSTDEDYAEFVQVMLDGAPDYEWDIGDVNMAGSRLRKYFAYLVALPEFQLT